MVPYRIIERPSFLVAGRKTWISGQDNSLFGQFWEECRAQGLLERLADVSCGQPGAQTGGVTLGISRVESDPARREFYYMIAAETAASEFGRRPGKLRSAGEYVGRLHLHAGKCRSRIVEAEIFAFSQWLPGSEYEHAFAPEMEVYLPGVSDDAYTCEFWLPIQSKA